MSLKKYIYAAPKAELHVHLEGSISPKTLLALAKRNRIDLPYETVEELQQWFTYKDFHHFIEVYVAITNSLKTVEDYELIVHEYGAEMARQNIRYAEVTFSPSNHRWISQISENIFLKGILQGRDLVRKEFGVEINWVFDLVRNAHPDDKKADYTTRIAMENMQDGVVAIGLGGMEDGYPPELFKKWFDMARGAGLHSAPHAGEHSGPDSIWGAIRALGAERIGHGVRACEDDRLVEYLAQHHIPIEVNPTSNICLGVYKSMKEHPFRQLHDAGVIVTINSDDPPLFNTSMNQEAALLSEPFGFDIATIDEILLNGIRHSFLLPDRKIAMERAFREEMTKLKNTLFQ